MNRPFIAFLLLLSLFSALFAVGCGGVSHNEPPPPPPPPVADHVFLVVLENHGFGEVIGNPVMPYLNSLVAANGLAVEYFANAHPSIPNYFMLTTGNEETLDDEFTGVITDDNLIRALNGAGKTWKAYIESLPFAGYTGPDAGLYLKRHNPFAYLSDITQSSTQAGNMVSLTQFPADMNAGHLSSFVYLLPNVENDAHNCPNGGTGCADNDKLAAADRWLRANVDPLLHSPSFGNSILVITFDEAELSDSSNGGGQVATVVVGPHVKPGLRLSGLFQHQSTLRLMLDSLRVSDMPGAAAGAPSMGGFFQ